MTTKPNRRMKIAVVADTINSAVGAGAVVSGQRFVNCLRENHEVLIIASDPYGSGVKLRGWRPAYLATLKKANFIIALPNRKLIREAIASVDIVHLQFPFWLSFVALSEARKAGKPVVASFHVQPENMLHNLGIRSTWLNRKLYEFWVKRLWNRADLVVCPTEFAAEKLKRFNLQAPIAVISNGVPTDQGPMYYEREAGHRGFFVIMMLGRLMTEKRQDLLIEAVRRCRHRDQIKIVIGGMGHCEKKLRKLAKSLPNGADIGYLTEERKRRMLATANLFVHCSEVELEGMAVLESMNAGLPVLVAEGPETAASGYALEDYRFPVGDADALAAKIDWIIEHPDELAHASYLYRQAAGNLSIEKSIESIEDKYQALLDR